MPSQAHLFLIQSRFGPQELFRALQTVTEHPAQRDHEPEFEFDWIARRVALSAASEAGLAVCDQQLAGQIEKLGGPPDGLIGGKIQTLESGRFLRPYGVLVQDAAAFGEMIGRSLVDLGVRGVQVVDKAGGVCELRVRINAFSKRVDYEAFIKEFPFPTYITLSDEGLQDVEEPETESVAAKLRRRKKR